MREPHWSHWIEHWAGSHWTGSHWVDWMEHWRTVRGESNYRRRRPHWRTVTVRTVLMGE